MTTKQQLVILTVATVSGCMLGLFIGLTYCEKKSEVNYCPAPRVERVEVPVGNQEVVAKFIECRRDLIEISEAFNSDINCHQKTCE